MSETMNAAPAAETKKYNLRNLEARDVFAVSQIISNIGLKELKTAFDPEKVAKITNSSDADGDELLQTVGIDVALELAGIIVGNLPKCERALYEFVGSLANIKPYEVEHMPIYDFYEVLTEIIKKPEFTDFMKVVSSLFK